MPEPNPFADFIRRIRAGDEQAAVELLRKYEPLIRRKVRLQIQDQRLNRFFDSMDVCQSVLGSFFVRAASGQYDLDRPDQLLRLLVTMARNKLVSAARRQRPDRGEHLENIADDSPSPSRVVAGRDLLQSFRDRLSERERQLADLRSQGLTWADIGGQLGAKPHACRMQLSRAVERVVQQMGLGEESHE